MQIGTANAFRPHVFAGSNPALPTKLGFVCCTRVAKQHSQFFEMEYEMMTRDEHLQWCKKRALEYVNIGDNQGAFASFASDMNKHDKTRGHIGIQLGMSMLMSGLLSTKKEMTNFIEGCN